MGSSELGWAMVKGYRFSIIRLQLMNSHVLMTARATGPLPAMTNEPVTVFGEDGSGICQGDGNEASGLTFPGCRKGDTVLITLRLKMDAVH